MRPFTAFAWLAAGALASCASPRRARGPLADGEGYPGELRPATTLGAEVLWQQTVTAHWPDGEHTFDAAVQVQGDTLLVVGLSPIGKPGFVLRLRDGEIDVQNDSGIELSLPPRYVLLDVQRVFFPFFPVAPTSGEGERSTESAGEHVDERWRAGRLVERRFMRLDSNPPGDIVVRYEWEHPDWLAPTRAVLANGWYGYSLQVTTHSETRLDEGSQ